MLSLNFIFFYDKNSFIVWHHYLKNYFVSNGKRHLYSKVHSTERYAHSWNVLGSLCNNASHGDECRVYQ